MEQWTPESGYRLAAPKDLRTPGRVALISTGIRRCLGKSEHHGERRNFGK